MRRNNEPVRRFVWSRVIAMAVLMLLMGTQMLPAGATELDPEKDAAHSESAESTVVEEDEDLEEAEVYPAKRELRIILRPVKKEGEEDPDLSEEIRRQITGQLVSQRGGEDEGDPFSSGGSEEFRRRLDRLCACVTWQYVYEDGIEPPGYDRPAGESPIYLHFDEDEEYCFFGEPLSEEKDAGENKASDEECDLPGDVSAEEEEASGGDLQVEEKEISKGDMQVEGKETSGGDLQVEEVSDPGQDPKSDEFRSFLTTTPAEKPEGDTSEEKNDEQNGEDAGQCVDEENGGAEDEDERQAAFDETQDPTDERESEAYEGRTPDEMDSTNDGNPVWIPEYSDWPVSHVQRAHDEGTPRTGPLGEARSGSPVTKPESGVRTGLPAAEVRLIRAGRDGQTDLTAEYSAFLDSVHGPEIDWENLLAVRPENDGVYTLTTVRTQDSGQRQEETVRFSVNRYGSVYVYNEAIHRILRCIVTKVQSDLIVSEYNPDRLMDGSLRMELTRDGVVLDPVRYRVIRRRDAGSDDDHRGWHRCDYVIYADNFNEDGVYRLKLSSAEVSGRRSETNAYNGGEIVFSIDATPPELQKLRGLERPSVTASEHEIRFVAFDSMGLARVSVTANGRPLLELDRFADPHRTPVLVRLASGERQEIRIEVTDQAGNTTVKDRVITIHEPEGKEAGRLKGAGKPPLILCLFVSGTVICAASFLVHSIRRRSRDGGEPH